MAKWKDIADEELKEIALDADWSIRHDCFSQRDVVNREMSLQELERRGYEIGERLEITRSVEDGEDTEG